MGDAISAAHEARHAELVSASISMKVGAGLENGP
jgi:hypothetical protein